MTRQMTPGDEFPSVRVLSQELRISPTTAHKVVAVLKDAGYLTSRPGIGMVVTAPERPSREQRLECLRPLCRQLAREAQEMDLALEDVVEAIKRGFKEAALT